MIITTYTCDKCGHEQKEPKQMWAVGIVAREQRDKTYTKYQDSPKEKVLWCRSCLVKLGILPSAVNDPPAPTPVPTLEDMILEIVQEAIDNNA